MTEIRRRHEQKYWTDEDLDSLTYRVFRGLGKVSDFERLRSSLETETSLTSFLPIDESIRRVLTRDTEGNFVVRQEYIDRFNRVEGPGTEKVRIKK